MKTIFLHGLGQTSNDWNEVIKQTLYLDSECPELFYLSENDITYSKILFELEKLYANITEPFNICGVSLGAILALNYTIRNSDKVNSLILIGVQYKVPSFIIDFQNLLFRFIPQKAFENIGISKKDVIKLAHSMRSLDLRRDLNKIKCPVTIICGEKDIINLKAAKKLGKILPQAELYIIPNVGHEVNKYAPETIANILNLKR